MQHFYSKNNCKTNSIYAIFVSLSLSLCVFVRWTNNAATANELEFDRKAKIYISLHLHIVHYCCLRAAYAMLSACVVVRSMQSNGEHMQPHAPIYVLTVVTISDRTKWM